MPELPEVESIKLQLSKYLIGHKIESIKVNYQKTFKGNPQKVNGAEVTAVRRFGKALVIDLNNHYSLIIHVKMTGQLIYQGPNLKHPPRISEKVKGGIGGKHTHVIFYLDKKGILYFVDYRKFGWIDTIETSKLKNQSFLKKLGPEIKLPSIKQNNITLSPDDFEKIIKKSTQSIKLTLMEQSKMSGVGNIYANDALFKARISPRRKSNSLNHKETTKLYKSIVGVLEKGVRDKGASELAYVTPDGTEGDYQNHVLVYGKEGENCPNGCGGKIKKIKLGGRGTYFCPNCQK